MASPVIGQNGEERRSESVLRARRDQLLAQHAAAVDASRRRYLVTTGSEPASSSTADVVMLRRDLLNVVGSPSIGAVEVEVVIDSDGGIRLYVVP